MGSLDWELCEFQSKYLLVFSSIVWKGYPVLLRDESLRSMIEGESFVLSHDVCFEALLVEPAVSGGSIVGMRVFVGGNLILMNGVVSHVGYVKYGKVLLYTPSLVLKGVMGKVDDLGSLHESQVIHSLKEMIVVDESNVFFGKEKGIVVAAPQVFEVMPLRYLGFEMVIFRQGFIHEFTGIVDAFSNLSLFGTSLLDYREDRIVDVMMNTLGMLFINFLGLVCYVEVEFGAKIRHVMSPDSGDSHDANLIGINMEIQDVIELVLNWLYEVRHWVWFNLCVGRIDIQMSINSGVSENEFCCDLFGWGANGDYHFGVGGISTDALGRLLVVTSKGCDQPAAMEASKKSKMFVMIIMIGMGYIGLDYIDEMNGDHQAGVGLRMKTASFEGIKTNAYGDIEKVASNALRTDGLLRKSWRIVFGLLLMVCSRVFYHLDWEVDIGKIKLGTRCAYKVIMLSGYSKLMTGVAVDFTVENGIEIPVEGIPL